MNNSFVTPEYFGDDSLVFKNSEIYSYFIKEYANYFNKKYECFSDFIKNKNLGIVCIDRFANKYMIIDIKKWMLTKIQYGFDDSIKC